MPSWSKVYKEAEVSGVRKYRINERSLSDSSRKNGRWAGKESGGSSSNSRGGTAGADRKKRYTSRHGEDSGDGNAKGDAANPGDGAGAPEDGDLESYLEEEEERLREKMKQEKEELLARAAEEAEEARKKAVEEGRQQGYREGYDQGYSAGSHRAEEDWQGLKKEMQAAVERAARLEKEAKERYHRAVEEAEQTVVELAMAAAEKLLYAQLDLEPEKTLQVVRQLLGEVPREEAVRIYVHPDDLPACLKYREEIEREYEVSKLEIYPWEKLPRGSCRAESDQGAVEINLEEEKQRLQEFLLQQARQGGKESPGDKSGEDEPAPAGEGTELPETPVAPAAPGEAELPVEREDAEEEMPRGSGEGDEINPESPEPPESPEGTEEETAQVADQENAGKEVLQHENG